MLGALTQYVPRTTRSLIAFASILLLLEAAFGQKPPTTPPPSVKVPSVTADQPTESNSADDSKKPQPGVSTFEKKTDPDVIKAWASMILAIVGALGFVWGIVVHVIGLKERRIVTEDRQALTADRRSLIAERDRLEEVRRGLRMPEEVPSNHKKNVALVIGLQNCGKSSLIQALVHQLTVAPSKTIEFEIFHLQTGAEADQGRGTQPYHLFLADYVGQNLGDLFSNFIEAQFISYSPIAFGYIDSLIFVVDVFDMPVNGQPYPEARSLEEVDAKRVKQQLNEWSQTAINAVFGLLTHSVRYVCLFINKADLLGDAAADEEVLKLETFGPLWKRLEAREKGANGSFKLECIVGSSNTGAGLNRLRTSLRERAVAGTGTTTAVTHT